MSKLASSPEAPLQLRQVSRAVGDWVSRLGEVWVEGQVAQFTVRPGVPTLFLTLRDVDANLSMQVTFHRSVLPAQLAEGVRVVLRARPDFYAERGTLSLRATEIRQIGLGELLARIAQLKQLLAAEGLFGADRKRRLPFLPTGLGLITGRASAAEQDVVSNVRRRVPGIRFSIENTATQGSSAVNEIIGALRRLDADVGVEVIIIARGGGSVEDLLPFSNEALLRAVAACQTPVISAIGHETDQPLLDLVADLAASTPTDAAKRVVPDLATESALLGEARSRMRTTIARRLHTERELMAGLPERLRRTVANNVASLAQRNERDRQAIRGGLDGRLRMAAAENVQMLARVVSLSPQAVLDRGYAVAWHRSGVLVKSATAIVDGEQLRVRVAHGEFEVQVVAGSGSVGPGSVGPGSVGPGSVGPGSVGPGSVGRGAEQDGANQDGAEQDGAEQGAGQR